MDTARTGLFGLSHLQVTAVLSVVLLLGTIAWNMYDKPQHIVVVASKNQTNDTGNTGVNAPFLNTAAIGATSSPITALGASILSQAVNAYGSASSAGVSSEKSLVAVEDVGKHIDAQVPYHVYAAGDVATDPDTSPARVLAYRADLRVALEPLFKHKEFELDIFAHYIDTGEAQYLEQLHTAANNYRAAAANVEKVVAPSDAASYHATILNAMGQFAATLDAMADNASDPLASAALLKTYMGAQENVLISFNAIGAYAAHKTL